MATRLAGFVVVVFPGLLVQISRKNSYAARRTRRGLRRAAKPILTSWLREINPF
jgi:hypothetical protein